MEEKITRILNAHGLHARRFNGRLQAEDLYSVCRNGRTVAGRGWMDVSDWNVRQVFNWLGY